MLLEDLLKLTQLGAKKPILFWLDEYREISLELQEKLTEIHDKMKEESNVKNNLQHLIELLKKEIPKAKFRCQSCKFEYQYKPGPTSCPKWQSIMVDWLNYYRDLEYKLNK